MTQLENTEYKNTHPFEFRGRINSHVTFPTTDQYKYGKNINNPFQEFIMTNTVPQESVLRK